MKELPVKKQKTDNSTKSFSNIFSDEIKVMIFSYLTPTELAKVSEVAKDWKRIAEYKPLWRNHCFKFFPQATVYFSKEKESDANWKNIFINNLKNTRKENALTEQAYADKIEELYSLLSTQDKADIDLDVDDEADINYVDDIIHGDISALKKTLHGNSLYTLVKVFLNRYIDVDKQYAYGNTLCHIAVFLEDKYLLGYLIKDKKANSHLKNSLNTTPLEIIAHSLLSIHTNRKVAMEMAEILIDGGATLEDNGHKYDEELLNLLQAKNNTFTLK